MIPPFILASRESLVLSHNWVTYQLLTGWILRWRFGRCLSFWTQFGSGGKEFMGHRIPPEPSSGAPSSWPGQRAKCRGLRWPRSAEIQRRPGLRNLGVPRRRGRKGGCSWGAPDSVGWALRPRRERRRAPSRRAGAARSGPRLGPAPRDARRGRVTPEPRRGRAAAHAARRPRLCLTLLNRCSRSVERGVG